ncbi:MAG TPA: hypothetical protein VGQ76_22215 [Thermoanaerobaculia bacterium]|nr:hypothetical protein [Thermoanaerobaculia bacterium]
MKTPEGPILDGGDSGGGKYAPSVLPAVAFGGGESLMIIDTAGWGPGKLSLMDSSTPLPYPVPKWLGYTMRLSADWTGSEFVVLAGKTLARHHPEGSLRGTISLGEDVRDSVGVAVDLAGVLVVKQRGGVMEAERVALPPW